MTVRSVDGQPKRMPRIDHCVKIVLDALYPSRCFLCSKPAKSGICPACLSGLDRIDSPCPRCGISYSGAGQCGSCQVKTPRYELTVAPFRYSPPLSGLVHQLKYHRKITCARILAKLLVNEIAQSPEPRPQLLVPVPLHWSRLLWRGFNQSVEIARHLSKDLQIPVDRTLARRIRKTSAQATLPIRQRKRNVKDCFDLRRPLHLRSIALVDDVITSGETVNQLAATLKQPGATLIQVWAPLRADL